MTTKCEWLFKRILCYQC